jgi:hypothetical protein
LEHHRPIRAGEARSLMSTKSDMVRVFTVGSTWARINLRFPTKMGGTVAKVGEPVRVKVIAQHKEGIIFELPSGDHSWLAWPQPEFMSLEVTPEKVTVQDRLGPLLTYTREATVAEAVVATMLGINIKP